MTEFFVDRGPGPASVPPQSRRHVAPVQDRIMRQVHAIDAWNASRRMRESLLEAACRSRLDRQVADRQRDALSHTHQVIQSRTADELARATRPMSFECTTAVIAHRHEWFAQKLAALLGDRGVTVLECTDNAADALGVVIAEQPDLVLAGDRLAMMPGDVLLAEVGLFAAATIRAVQVDGPHQLAAWARTADEVFFRHHPPADVAEVLSARCRTRTLEHGQV